MVDRNDWLKTRVEAYIWWCGDYDCDCTQPRIEEVSPNLAAGYPGVRRKTLWEGTYHSQGSTDDLDAQKQELKAALSTLVPDAAAEPKRSE